MLSQCNGGYYVVDNEFVPAYPPQPKKGGALQATQYNHIPTNIRKAYNTVTDIRWPIFHLKKTRNASAAYKSFETVAFIINISPVIKQLRRVFRLLEVFFFRI